MRLILNENAHSSTLITTIKAVRNPKLRDFGISSQFGRTCNETVSRKAGNTERTDKMFNAGRREETGREENRTFFLQVINDFDGRMGNELYDLRARLDESWDNDESRASPPRSQEYLTDEIKRLSIINENLEKRQMSLEQKVKKVKRPPHERMLRCVSKGFRKLKESMGAKTGKSTDDSPADANNYKTETQTSSAYSSDTSAPSLLKWSSAKPRIFSVEETDEPEYEHTKRREDSYGLGVAMGRIHRSPRGQRFKFRCRTKSEIRSDPNFSTHLLKWPPTDSTLKPAVKKSGPAQERSESWEQRVDVSIAGMSSTPKGPRVNFKTRTVSEIKRDPHFSDFLLKWPPECSALKPVQKECGTSKYSENWGKDVKKGHKHFGRFDLRKVRMPSTKPCETPPQEAGSRDVGGLRIPGWPQAQQKLLGGSEIPDSCEHFTPRYTLKSAMNTGEASWESGNKDWPEELSSVQIQKSGIQYRAAEVSKDLEKATIAKIYWVKHIRELEKEAKGLEVELKDIDKKMEPRNPTTVSQGKNIHTKKFKRKLKK